MEVFKHMLRDMRRVNNKKALVAAAFAMAVVATLGLGLVTRSSVQAASTRDSGHNPIINTGSIGCLTAAECISDMRRNNPSDLQDIYAHFGLAPSEYERFLKDAKVGQTTSDGKMIVDGQMVSADAWSTGRDKFNDKRIAYTVKGKTYYKSRTQDSFASGVKSLDTLVLFKNDGTVEFALLTACGNPVWGNNVTPKYSCDALRKTAVAGKANTYSFTTNASAYNNASIVQVEYDFGDGSPKKIVKNPNQPIVHTYDVTNQNRVYTAKVRVLVELPGGNHKIITGIKCQTNISVQGYAFACQNLIAAALDDKKQKFRFTTVAKASNGPVAMSADFTADGNTTTGVTTKDAQGNFYKEYTWTDTANHTVKAVIHFTFQGKDLVSTQKCEATVSSKKTPMCEVPGKENLPPNSPQCFEECKPGIPVGDERCNPVRECKPGIAEGDERCNDTPPSEEEECKPGVPAGSADCEEAPSQMPNTGVGGVAGIFTGATLLGAAGHRLFKNRFFGRKS